MMQSQSMASTPAASRPNTSGGGNTPIAQRGRSARHSKRTAAAPSPPPTSSPTVLYPATPRLAILAREDAEDAAASRLEPIPPQGGLQQAIGADQFEIQGETAFVPRDAAASGRKARAGAQQQSHEDGGGRRHYKALVPDQRKTQPPARPPSAAAAAVAAVAAPVLPVVAVDAYGAEVKRYGTPLDRQREALRRALMRFHRAEEREAKTKTQQRTGVVVPPPVAPQPLLYEPLIARPFTSSSAAGAAVSHSQSRPQSRPSSSFSSRPTTAASHSQFRATTAAMTGASESEHSVPFWLPLTKREGSALFDEVLDAGPPALSAGKLAVGGLHASAERKAVSLRIHHAVERQALQTQIAEDALISAHDRARAEETAQRAWEASQRDINPYSYDPLDFATHAHAHASHAHNAAHPSAYIPYLPRELAQQEMAATHRRGSSGQKQAASRPEIAFFYAADGSLQQTIVPAVAAPVPAPAPVPFAPNDDRDLNPSALRDPALPNLLGWVMSLHPERVALRAAAERWRGNAARNDAAMQRAKGGAQYPPRLQQRQQKQEEEEEKQQYAQSHSHSMPRSLDSSPIISQSVSARHSTAASPLYVTPRPPTHAHARGESEAAAAARELQEQRDIMNAANCVTTMATAGGPARNANANANAAAATNAAVGTKPVPATAAASPSGDSALAADPAPTVQAAPWIVSSRSTPPVLQPGSYPAHIPRWKASILAGEAQQVERLRAQSAWRRAQGLEESDADQVEIMRHMALAHQPGLVARLATPAPLAPAAAAPVRPSPTQDLLSFASRHRTTPSGTFRLPLTSTPDPNSLLPIIPGPEVVVDSQSFPPPFALSALTDSDLMRAPRPNFAALGESKAEATRNRLREMQHEALFDVNEIAALAVEERRSRRGSTHQLGSNSNGSSAAGDDAAAASPSGAGSTIDQNGRGSRSGTSGSVGLPPSHRSKSRSAHISSENASILLHHRHRSHYGGAGGGAGGTHRPKSARVHQALGLKKRRSSLGSDMFGGSGGGGFGDSGPLDLSFLPSAAQLVHESALRESLFEYFRNPSECSFVSSELSHALDPHTPWLLELLADCRAYALHQSEVMELLRTINAASMRPSDVIETGVGVVQAFRAQLDALGRVPKFPRAPSEIAPSASKGTGGAESSPTQQQLSGSPWHTAHTPGLSDADTVHPRLEEDAVVQRQASELAFSLRAGPTLPPGVAAAARRPLSAHHAETASASASSPTVTFARSVSKSDADQSGRVRMARFASEQDAVPHPLQAEQSTETPSAQSDAALAELAPTAAAAADSVSSAVASVDPSPVVASASSLSSGDADRAAIVDWLQSDACLLFLDSPTDLSVSLGEIDRLLEAGGGVEPTLATLKGMSDAGVRFNEFTDILPAMQQKQQQQQQPTEPDAHAAPVTSAVSAESS